MNANNLMKILLSLFLIALSTCTHTNDKNEFTMEEFKKELKDNSSLIVLDVRTEAELSGPLGHIPGVVHIPVDELQSRINELDQYKNNLIAVICRSGVRSERATNTLSKNGFNAKNVLGGMLEYRKE